MVSFHKDNIIKGWDFSLEDINNATKKNNPICLNPSIDLTNACNLNCPYCYIEDKNSIRKKRKKDELSIDETFNVIKTFSEMGAKTINIVGAGEPTIDQHFESVIRGIYDLGMTTVLFTNGVKFKSDSLVDLCFKHNVSIVLKLNSLNETNQDLVAGKNGYYKNQQIALNKLIKRGFNLTRPTRLGIDTILYSGNLFEMPEIHKFARLNNLFPITADFIPTGRTLDGKLVNNEDYILQTHLNALNSSEKKYIKTQIELIDKNFNIKKNNSCSYYGGGICTQILGMYVDITGNIYPCVARSKIKNNQLISYNYGNIRDGLDLKNIWFNDEYLINLRNNFDGGCPYKQNIAEI